MVASFAIRLICSSAISDPLAGWLKKRVIPRLAQRAEGPHRRSYASAKVMASTVISRSMLLRGAICDCGSLGALRQSRDDNVFVRPISTSPHFELAAQNPVQDAEQPDGGCNQYDRVEDEHVHLETEIAFLFAEKHIQLSAAPVIALLHFGV
jgi:hypothetical protein